MESSWLQIHQPKQLYNDLNANKESYHCIKITLLFNLSDTCQNKDFKRQLYVEYSIANQGHSHLYHNFMSKGHMNKINHVDRLIFLII